MPAGFPPFSIAFIPTSPMQALHRVKGKDRRLSDGSSPNLKNAWCSRSHVPLLPGEGGLYRPFSVYTQKRRRLRSMQPSRRVDFFPLPRPATLSSFSPLFPHNQHRHTTSNARYWIRQVDICFASLCAAMTISRSGAGKELFLNSKGGSLLIFYRSARRRSVTLSVQP